MGPSVILRLLRGQVAQLVEHRTENPGVGGSIPSLPTIFPGTSAVRRSSTVRESCGNAAAGSPPPSRSSPCAGWNLATGGCHGRRSSMELVRPARMSGDRLHHSRTNRSRQPSVRDEDNLTDGTCSWRERKGRPVVRAAVTGCRARACARELRTFAGYVSYFANLPTPRAASSLRRRRFRLPHRHRRPASRMGRSVPHAARHQPTTGGRRLPVLVFLEGSRPSGG